jgi:hypothetical protein
MVPMIHFDENILGDIDYNRVMNGNWLMSLGDHDIDQVLLQDQPICADVLKVLTNRVPGATDLLK